MKPYVFYEHTFAEDYLDGKSRDEDYDTMCQPYVLAEPEYRDYRGDDCPNDDYGDGYPVNIVWHLDQSANGDGDGRPANIRDDSSWDPRYDEDDEGPEDDDEDDYYDGG